MYVSIYSCSLFLSCFIIMNFFVRVILPCFYHLVVDTFLVATSSHTPDSLTHLLVRGVTLSPYRHRYFRFLSASIFSLSIGINIFETEPGLLSVPSIFLTSGLHLRVTDHPSRFADDFDCCHRAPSVVLALARARPRA